jgi:hypothetical protein
MSITQPQISWKDVKSVAYHAFLSAKSVIQTEKKREYMQLYFLSSIVAKGPFGSIYNPFFSLGKIFYTFSHFSNKNRLKISMRTVHKAGSM